MKNFLSLNLKKNRDFSNNSFNMFTRNLIKATNHFKFSSLFNKFVNESANEDKKNEKQSRKINKMVNDSETRGSQTAKYKSKGFNKQYNNFKEDKENSIEKEESANKRISSDTLSVEKDIKYDKYNWKNKSVEMPKGKNGKSLSIFICKNTQDLMAMYYSNKMYFNSDINNLVKVFVHFCNLANMEGLRGIENLSKERIVKELIRNLSEKIDNNEIIENHEIINIMKILKHNKFVYEYKFKSEYESRIVDLKKNKKNEIDAYNNNSKTQNLINNLIENFVIEKIFKKLNLKIFLKNLENGNQMSLFIKYLTSITKITDLKNNIKFIFFKAEVLNNYDAISLSRYKTSNLITLLWSLSYSFLTLPDIYYNITNEVLNRYEYLNLENKIQILFTSAKQRKFNLKLVEKIMNEIKDKIKNENKDYLMHHLLDVKLLYFNQFIYFLHIWGITKANLDKVMNEDLYNNIMRFVYFKFIKRRKLGDDLIFSEYDHETKTHKEVLLEIDRINLLSVILRYTEFSKSFKFDELCFEELYLKNKKNKLENQIVSDMAKETETHLDGLNAQSEEEEEMKLINEINNESIKKINNISNNDDTTIKPDTSSSETEQKLHDMKQEEIQNSDLNKLNEDEKQLFYFTHIASKNRKYELDLSDVKDEFFNAFGYNIYGYIEYQCSQLLSLILIDNEFKGIALFQSILKVLKDEHYKINPHDYIRVCALIPMLLKIIKFYEKNQKLMTMISSHSQESKKPLYNKKSETFIKLIKSNEKNFANFAKGILNENIFNFYLKNNCELSIIIDIINIIDRIRMQDNLIYSKIVNISSEEIKAFIESSINNNFSILNFDQTLCLVYLITTLKISLDKKLSLGLKQAFIEKFREDIGKSRFKPFKKSLVNSILYFIDLQLREEMSQENGKGITSTNIDKGDNKKEIQAQEISDKNLSNKEHSDSLLHKVLKTDLSNGIAEKPKDDEIKLNKDKINFFDDDNLLNMNFDLNKFIHYDSYENLRLSQSIGVEERDLYFSLSAFNKLDNLLNSIKKLQYFSNQIFHNNFYLDFYIPKLNIGFLIFSPLNYFAITDTHRVTIIEDFPNLDHLTTKPLMLKPLLDLFKNKYNIDVYVVNEDILNFKYDEILRFLKKFNPINV